MAYNNDNGNLLLLRIRPRDSIDTKIHPALLAIIFIAGGAILFFISRQLFIRHRRKRQKERGEWVEGERDAATGQIGPATGLEERDMEMARAIMMSGRRPGGGYFHFPRSGRSSMPNSRPPPQPLPARRASSGAVLPPQPAIIANKKNSSSSTPPTTVVTVELDSKDSASGSVEIDDKPGDASSSMKSADNETEIGTTGKTLS